MNFKKIMTFSIATLMTLTTTVFASSMGSVTTDTEVVNSEEEVVKEVNEGVVVKVVEKEGDLYKVDEDQYIDADDIVITKTTATANDATAIYEYPTANSDELSTVDADTELEVFYKANDGWYQVSNGMNLGYMQEDDITGDLIDYVDSIEVEAMANVTSAKYGEVTASDSLVIRKAPSTDAASITAIPSGDFVTILASSDNWAEIDYDGTTGFVSIDYLEINDGEIPPQPTKGDEVTAYAKKFIGNPYVWGGTSLSSGADCSGFTSAIYSDFGISLNRTSRSQINNGTRVSKSELAAGDLVFFDTAGSNNGNICHVGIYIGNGQFIHSSTSRGVIISPINTGFYSSAYVGATRVLS